MPLIRSLISEYYAYIVLVIFLFSKIMFIYSRCAKKKLVYIAIIAPSSYQPSFYLKCIKLNIYLSYNVRSVLNAEYL